MKLKGLLVSDFTINNLSGYLNNLEAGVMEITTEVAPFNQVQQVLLNKALECWNSKPDFSLVFCLPERVIDSFSKYLNKEPISLDLILKEVDEFADKLIKCSERLKFTLVASFVYNFNQNDLGELSHVVSCMNIRLYEKFKTASGIYLLDAQGWISKVGLNAFQPKSWYLAKIPFHNSVFEYATYDIQQTIKRILGSTKKMLIVDLDDTLWGGVVGEVGFENLKLGGHDPLGEAYVDFQKALLSLSKTGTLLAIASKNEEDVAMSAIEKHSAMVLRKGNFVAWRINWNDKAQNIIELTEELNLGLDSVVFIDDNPAERARVKQALPQVLVPEMPVDKLLYPSFLKSLNCFNAKTVSPEDSLRTKYYGDEKIRSASKESFQSVDEWLASIEIKIFTEPINKSNIQRVVQLLNKTNQLNLSTRRMTEKQVEEFVSCKSNSMFAFYFLDKYGDAGLVGVLGLTYEEGQSKITDFVLSCRVLGRKCEDAMLSFAINEAKKNGCKKMIAEYLLTERNRPCLDFLKNSGMIQHNNTFSWNCQHEYSLPSYINFKAMA